MSNTDFIKDIIEKPADSKENGGKFFNDLRKFDVKERRAVLNETNESIKNDESFKKGILLEIGSYYLRYGDKNNIAKLDVDKIIGNFESILGKDKEKIKKEAKSEVMKSVFEKMVKNGISENNFSIRKVAKLHMYSNDLGIGIQKELGIKEKGKLNGKTFQVFGKNTFSALSKWYNQNVGEEDKKTFEDENNTKYEELSEKFSDKEGNDFSFENKKDEEILEEIKGSGIGCLKYSKFLGVDFNNYKDLKNYTDKEYPDNSNEEFAKLLLDFKNKGEKSKGIISFVLETSLKPDEGNSNIESIIKVYNDTDESMLKELFPKKFKKGDSKLKFFLENIINTEDNIEKLELSLNDDLAEIKKKQEELNKTKENIKNKQEKLVFDYFAKEDEFLKDKKLNQLIRDLEEKNSDIFAKKNQLKENKDLVNLRKEDLEKAKTEEDKDKISKLIQEQEKIISNFEKEIQKTEEEKEKILQKISKNIKSVLEKKIGNGEKLTKEEKAFLGNEKKLKTVENKIVILQQKKQEAIEQKQSIKNINNLEDNYLNESMYSPISNPPRSYEKAKNLLKGNSNIERSLINNNYIEFVTNDSYDDESKNALYSLSGLELDQSDENGNISEKDKAKLEKSQESIFEKHKNRVNKIYRKNYITLALTNLNQQMGIKLSNNSEQTLIEESDNQKADVEGSSLLSLSGIFEGKDIAIKFDTETGEVILPSDMDMSRKPGALEEFSTMEKRIKFFNIGQMQDGLKDIDSNLLNYGDFEDLSDYENQLVQQSVDVIQDNFVKANSKENNEFISKSIKKNLIRRELGKFDRDFVLNEDNSFKISKQDNPRKYEFIKRLNDTVDFSSEKEVTMILQSLRTFNQKLTDPQSRASSKVLTNFYNHQEGKKNIKTGLNLKDNKVISLFKQFSHKNSGMQMLDIKHFNEFIKQIGTTGEKSPKSFFEKKKNNGLEDK